MSAGSVQIIATGPQDKFITGDPEVSFFGVNYKRHTNFALTRQQQLLQGKLKLTLNASVIYLVQYT
jgi:hypothetical protein